MKNKTKNTEILPDVSKLDAYSRECWNENEFRIGRTQQVGDTFRLYWYQPKMYQYMVDVLRQKDMMNDTFWGQIVTAVASDDVEGELKKLNPDYKKIWNNVKSKFDKNE